VTCATFFFVNFEYVGGTGGPKTGTGALGDKWRPTMSKTLKTLVAALVLATASVTLAANSYAATHQEQVPSDGERAWMDHASQNVDGGG
jgi:hypothetical protein